MYYIIGIHCIILYQEVLAPVFGMVDDLAGDQHAFTRVERVVDHRVAALDQLGHARCGLVERMRRCNAVAPGFIETPMTQALSEEARKSWMTHIPLHRGGSDTDVARVSLFLASDLASYVTGNVVRCDGGLSL